MPGGRGAEGWFPRSVGVLAAEEPLADSAAGALLDRLRAALPADVSLSFHGPRPADAPGLLPAGVRRAASPADLAARAELLVLAVPDLEVVRTLLDGPAGIQAGVHSPTIQVVGATCAPESLRTLATELLSVSAGRLRTVDAPLVGRPAEIRAGELPIMAGAAWEVFDLAEPVLSLLGPTTRVGGVGQGQVAAAGTRFVLASTMAALVEAAVVVRRSGLDLVPLFASWQDSDLMRRAVDDVSSRLLGPTTDPIPPTAWSRSLAVAQAEAVRTRTRTDLLDAVLTAYAEVAENSEPGDDLVQRLERLLSVPHDRRAAVEERRGEG